VTADQVATELQRRGCQLFHAINLPDFRTYVGLGALVSREELLRKGLGTPFVSDESDKARGLLDRCFGNFADFGIGFWKRPEGPPNVYGPILLIFKPEVFGKTRDAAVTTKNAGSPDFDLARDRISTPEDLRAIFKEDDGAALAPYRFFTEFSTSTNTVPFDFLDRIVVEPLTFDLEKLVDRVNDLVGGRWTVVEREPRPLKEKLDLLDALAGWSAERGGTPPGPSDEPPLGVGDWWKKMRPRGAGFRWFQYIVSTLKELSPNEIAAPAPEPPRCIICERHAGTRCSGCNRWLCFDDYFGMTVEGKFDAKVQARCWECCYDPT
jgi:hypothetical protein